MTLLALLLVGLQQQVVRDDQCIKCHEDQAAEVKETMHQRAGVGCVSCHGTDEIVNEKHKRTSAFRPAKLPQIAELCGSCHLAVSEFYWMSPHADAASKDDGEPKHRSSCSACHGYHTTTGASIKTIMNECLKCHEPASHEVVEAGSFFRTMGDYHHALLQLEEELARLDRAPGIRIFDLKGSVEEGRAALRRLRISQHGLDWKRLKADAAASADRTSAAYNALAAREGSFARRFLGLGLFLGLLALSAVLVVRRARTLQGESGS